MNEVTERFWTATLEEIKRGYVYNEPSDEFHCLLCGQAFVKGVIYQEDGVLYEAEKYTSLHIESEHTSVFEHLLGLDKKMTGLTHHQKVLLDYFNQGLSDNEIVKELGGSSSTIRNHRFTMREKEKQAKIFLAIMELLGQTSAKRKVERLPMNRRMELKNEYKQTPRPVGIIQIKNNVNGKVFLYSGLNLEGNINKERFQLKTGTHRNPELQRDYKEFGAENFTFEVLEQLKPREVGHDYREELEEVMEKWLEKLQPYGDKGYNKQPKA